MVAIEGENINCFSHVAGTTLDFPKPRLLLTRSRYGLLSS